MQLEDIAQRLLWGERWEDKFTAIDLFLDSPRRSPWIEAPDRPGRPERLMRFGRSPFPDPESLVHDSSRGRLLHFFANHELLAIELMALALLKFPDADPSYRAGLARTIEQEQAHLRLYVRRMGQLGIDFGDLPLSDYFWNAIKDVPDPLRFVVQMNLTLEQANLDYAHFYRNACLAVGDGETASILRRVYLDEIGHVKHGVTWFNRWRQAHEKPEDDWEAYLRLLPLPMTPRRAKGALFCDEPRRLAGFSERYIREMETFTGSKGRPPTVWIFNALCEAEIARGKPGNSPPASVRRFLLDLETLPMFLARETDVVLVKELPDPSWIKQLQALGLTTPEFRATGSPPDEIRENKIAGFEPWGWSPEPFAHFRPFRERLIAVTSANGSWCQSLLNHEKFSDTGLGNIFSKSWSAARLKNWLRENPADTEVFGPTSHVAEVCTEWESARAYAVDKLSQKQSLVAKAPFGTSGTQNKRLLTASDLDSTIGGWIRNVIESQGEVLLEPWLPKIADLSLQLEVPDDTVRLLGVRRFETGKTRFDYLGTHLDPKLGSLPNAVLRFWHGEKRPRERWLRVANYVGESLRTAGYRGPAGIDALIGEVNSEIFIKPIVEINPRWTMGRIALELEKFVLPGTPATWRFLSARDLEGHTGAATPREAARKLRELHPPRIVEAANGRRLSEGMVFTTDPEKSHEVWTVLAVGKKAVSDPALSF